MGRGGLERLWGFWRRRVRCRGWVMKWDEAGCGWGGRVVYWIQDGCPYRMAFSVQLRSVQFSSVQQAGL